MGERSNEKYLSFEKIIKKLNIMKNLKKALYLFLVATLFLTSCKKEEIEQIEQHPESQAMKTVVNHLTTRLVGTSTRPSGTAYRSATALEIDMVLENEFCFNFQYPITVVMSNNALVTVNDASEFQYLLTASSSMLSVIGIQYPFSTVGSSNPQQGVPSVTIHNDNEFNTLIGNACDNDGDGIANYLDDDIDGDSLLNTEEDLNGNGNLLDDDTDTNGTPNYLDSDDDGDGVETADEDINGNGDLTDDDTDGDGIPNYLDSGDYPTVTPSIALQTFQANDYCFDYVYPITVSMSDNSIITINNDTDRHNIVIISNPVATPYAVDIVYPFSIMASGTSSVINNLGQYFDAISACNTSISPQGDEDQDSVFNIDEDLNGNGDYTDDDTDGDGTPNYLDNDDDGDGILTINEDANGNGTPVDDDTDGDGIPDYLDNN